MLSYTKCAGENTDDRCCGKYDSQDVSQLLAVNRDTPISRPLWTVPFEGSEMGVSRSTCVLVWEQGI